MKYKEVVKKTMEFGLPTLTDSEREYLSAVIKPFRDDVKWIRKDANGDTCWILIGVTNWEIEFPNFGSSEHYQGLEQDREYTLEELGL